MDKIKTVEVLLQNGNLYGSGYGIPFTIETSNVFWDSEGHLEKSVLQEIKSVGSDEEKINKKDLLAVEDAVKTSTDLSVILNAIIKDLQYIRNNYSHKSDVPENNDEIKLNNLLSAISNITVDEEGNYHINFKETGNSKVIIENAYFN